MTDSQVLKEAASTAEAPDSSEKGAGAEDAKESDEIVAGAVASNEEVDESEQESQQDNPQERAEESREEELVSTSQGPDFTDELFKDLDLMDSLQGALQTMGYVNPTEVQLATLNPGLAGRDLVVQAKTGSGKTTAFSIPVIQRLQEHKAESCKPRAIILVPTRELAHQVANECRALCAGSSLKVFAVYGGVSIGRQAGALKGGIDIVVGTPGRLLDHLRRKNLLLDDVNTIVLDEADEMLSMGFWDDVTGLLRDIPGEKQTMLFSATLPYQIAKAAAEFLKEPERIDVSGDELTVEGIRNLIYQVVPDIPKPRQLLYLLENESPSSAIVFCNTRNETEMIAKYLTQAGFIAEPLMGSARQRERERVMSRIKSGELRFMVATDIAARGIDIAHLSHVFNYSLPEFSEVYLHRVGRTGRAGKEGTATSMVDGKGLTTYTELQREFGVEFETILLQEESIILQARSERIMKELQEKASVAEVGQHLPVAEDILKSEEGAQMVAFLLKSYFNKAASDSAVKDKEKPERSRQARSNEDGDDDQPRRRRRRRRRGRRSEEDDGRSEGRGDKRNNEGRQSRQRNQKRSEEGAEASSESAGAQSDGNIRLRVNIGFEDGFKGRGAVAKKISVLAGLNDGLVSEVESRRHHAVLKVSPQVAELLVDRVNGAQLGKKIIEISEK